MFIVSIFKKKNLSNANIIFFFTTHIKAISKVSGILT